MSSLSVRFSSLKRVTFPSETMELESSGLPHEMNKKTEQSKLIVKDDDEEDTRACSRCCEFPKSIYFIIVTEFCERFTYYGLRAVLIIYLTAHLSMKQNDATALYHFFVCLCYFSPLFGAFLADNYFGKFRTILSVSVIYAVGNAILTFTAMAPPNLPGPIVGLILIGIGTGGIKPCVSALGGDQIPRQKKYMLESFFSVFYFSINLGSAISTFVTPILRADVQCFKDDCYALAFGLPAILMVIAILIFFLGRKLYVNVPAEGNVIGKSITCVFHAFSNYIKHRKSEPKKNFLDYASDQYDEAFITDIRAVGRIFFLFVPLPMFWALYDQQGSRWTLQAAQLDGYMFAGWTLHPDQMTVFNTVLILLLIPIFESCVYPLLKKLRIPNSPLQRMTVGQLLAAFAFLAAFFLQLTIESKDPIVLNKGQSEIRFVNMDPCPVLVEGNVTIGYAVSPVAVIPSNVKAVNLQFDKCSMSSALNSMSATEPLAIKSEHRYTNFIWRSNSGKVGMASLETNHTLDRKGRGRIRVVGVDIPAKGTLQLVTTGTTVADTIKLNAYQQKDTNAGLIWVTKYQIIEPGRYMMELKLPNTGNRTAVSLGQLTVYVNSVTTLTLRLGQQKSSNSDQKTNKPDLVTDWLIVPVAEHPGHSTSILFQLPQYVIITLAEILFSITGLSFAYSEAPTSMKSLVTAAWLTTVAIGNVIVIMVAEVHLISKQSMEFMIFFILCLVSTVVFVVFAYLYKPHLVQEHQLENLPAENSNPELEKIE